MGAHLNAQKRAKVINDIVTHVIDSADSMAYGETAIKLKYQDGEIVAFEINNTKKYKLYGNDILKEKN